MSSSQGVAEIETLSTEENETVAQEKQIAGEFYHVLTFESVAVRHTTEIKKKADAVSAKQRYIPGLSGCRNYTIIRARETLCATSY